MIIKFAVKCSEGLLSLLSQDYEQLRDEGVSDQEILEIIAPASLGKFTNTMADSVKVDMEHAMADAAAMG